MDKNNDRKTARIFTMEQQFPCGPNSSCCGPIGQSKEEISALKDAIEKLGIAAEVCDIRNMKNLKEHPQVFKLFRTFGPQAVPVITIGDEIACMGDSGVQETVSAIRAKL